MKRLALALPVLLLVLSGCLTTGKITKRHVRLVSVTDGDTIKVRVAGKLEPVRLVGIECAEIRRTAKARRQAEERGLTLEELLAKGRAATERLRKLVEGRRVELSGRTRRVSETGLSACSPTSRSMEPMLGRCYCERASPGRWSSTSIRGVNGTAWRP